MPILESTGEITPKSVLRHRPIGEDADPHGKKPAMTPVSPVAQRASRNRPKVTEGDDDAKNSRTQTPPQHITTGPKSLPKVPVPKGTTSKKKLTYRAHPLLYLGVGMIAMLALWTLLTSVIGWWNTTMDDIHYGRPRTFQIDAVVGHNDSAANPSHFIAINLNSRIEIIEFPGGDGSKARIYLGPQLFGPGEDLVPVTLSFTDVNGDHRPDMLIHFHYRGWLGFSNSEQELVYINENGGFRPATPNELHAAQHYLQQHGR